MNRTKKLAVLAASALLIGAYPAQTARAAESENWYRGEMEDFYGYDTSNAGDYGYIAPSGKRDVPMPKKGTPGLLGRAALPAAYMNDIETLTATYPGTKSQGEYNTCWAFSAAALAEFDLITDDKIIDRSTEFSILQMAYFTYNHVEDPLEGTYGDAAELKGSNYKALGGNLDFASRKLMQWVGPVEEFRFPYSSVSSTDSIENRYAYEDTAAHLQNIYLLDVHEDPDAVKEQIMEHGSVGAGYYAPTTDSERSSYTGFDRTYGSRTVDTYYCDDSAAISNHAVNIVGWDDAFPASSFARTPAGDGAWLIRNSWSDTTDFAEGSYFWMSYYDASLEDEVWVLDFEPADNYDYNYQYDGGITAYDGYRFDTVANVFSVRGEANEELLAVSVSLTSHADVPYTIKIYTNVADEDNPRSGYQAATVKGRTDYAGVYTIPLENPVPLAKGTLFSVVVETPESTGVDVEYGMDAWNGMLRTKAYIAPCQSYAYYYGEWQDMEELNMSNRTGNVCVKAYTSSLKGKKVDQVKNLKKKEAKKTSLTLKWSKVSGANGYEIFRSTSKNGTYKKIKTVSGTTFKDTGLKKNKTYYYRVRAIRYNTVQEDDRTETTTVGKMSARLKLSTTK